MPNGWSKQSYIRSFVKLLLLKIVKMCECMENAKTIYEVVVEPCTKK